jgi:hypothetical protein
MQPDMSCRPSAVVPDRMVVPPTMMEPVSKDCLGLYGAGIQRMPS